MKRWLVLLIIMTLALPASVLAGVTWCKSDPVVSLNGTILDITVEIPLEYVPLVNGPVQYTIQTPYAVERTVIVSDLGYNLYGSRVTFTNRTGGMNGENFLTTVSATVPINRAGLPAGTVVPARLTVFPTNGSLNVVEGTAESTSMTRWITGKYGTLDALQSTIQGTGDFDGDGKNDILWRNRLTGKLTIWLMDGVDSAQRGLAGNNGRP